MFYCDDKKITRVTLLTIPSSHIERNECTIRCTPVLAAVVDGLE